MIHTLDNGKKVNIPQNEIEHFMTSLQLTKEEAVDLWLTDHDFEEDEEQNELDEKAKKIKIQHDAIGAEPRKKSEKPRTVKVSDTKKELFASILQNIDRCVGVERENVTVLKENKLIEVKIGEDIFKIDIIQQRKPKK